MFQPTFFVERRLNTWYARRMHNISVFEFTELYLRFKAYKEDGGWVEDGGGVEGRGGSSLGRYGNILSAY